MDSTLHDRVEDKHPPQKNDSTLLGLTGQGRAQRSTIKSWDLGQGPMGGLNQEALVLGLWVRNVVPSVYSMKLWFEGFRCLSRGIQGCREVLGVRIGSL